MELQNLDKACKKVQESLDKKVKIVTHLDVDGLTSYTILKKTFERLNADFDIEYVSHIAPETLDGLELNEYDLILFADLGSSSLHILNEHEDLHGKDVIVLDHHYPIEVKPNFNLIHVNPNISGYKGDSSACGATVSYLLARFFNFTDLAKYSVIGALGDAQASGSGQLEDFNTIPLRDMQDNITVKNALQVYGKFSRPLILSLKYSSNIFSDFGESDNSALALLYKIKKDTGIEIPYHYPYFRLSEKHIQVLARYLYMYMHNFVPKQFYKYLQYCLYGKMYYINVDTDEIMEKPWSYDLEEVPAFLNASIRMREYKLVTEYLNEGKHEKTLLSNYKKYKQKLSKTIRQLEDLCEYNQMDNIQYYIAYQESGIETTLSGVLAGMLYAKPFFEYTKPNIGIVEFDEGWKVSIRGSKLLQFTDFHAGRILIKLSKQYGGSAGGHTLAAGAILPYDVDLDSFLQDLNKLCQYNVIG